MALSRNLRARGALLIALILGLCTGAPAAEFAGGTGEPNDPYRIATAEQLMAIDSDNSLSYKHFVLVADIDLSGETWSGCVIVSFSGTFDGNGFCIHNMGVRHGEPEAKPALFGEIHAGATVRNLGIVDVNAASSGDAGALARRNSGDIINCYSTGSVAGKGTVGDLVARNSGRVIDCHTAGTVMGSIGVGGLVGVNSGLVFNCHSACNTASGEGGSWVGGLVGNNSGRIVNCYSTGPVSGGFEVGGLLGDNSGNVINCYSTGSVAGNMWVGGLLGSHFILSSVVNCYSTGLVTGRRSVGGLVGENVSNDGCMTNCLWDVETSHRTRSAGGAGMTTAQMQDRATFLNAGWDFVDESANGVSEIWQMPDGGGYPVLSTFSGHETPEFKGRGTPDDPYLVSTPGELGAAWRQPAASYRLVTDIDLSGIIWPTAVIPEFSGVFDGNDFCIRGLTIVGGGYVGLFGRLAAEGDVKDLRLVDVNVSGDGHYVGGLAGLEGDGTVVACSVAGTIIGSRDCVGALAGQTAYGGSVRECCSYAVVQGRSDVGGLVGYGGADTINCHSSGTVIGARNVGGLAGQLLLGSVVNCYSACGVNAKEHGGGLVGWNAGVTVSHSFWDTQVSGLSRSGGGTGLTTLAMQTSTTYLDAGWDFEGVWMICEGRDYPRLRWEGMQCGE